MKVRAATLAVAAFILPLVLSPSALARREARTYVGGTGDYFTADVIGDLGVGGATFVIRGEQTARVSILDHVGLVTPWRVGGVVAVWDGRDRNMYLESFCGTSSIINLSSEAAFLTVWVDGANGIAKCPGSIGAGTAGRILAEFVP